MNSTADLLSRPPTVAIKTLDVKIEIDWADEQDGYKEIAIDKANIRNSSKSVEYKELENHEIWIKNRDFFLISKKVLFSKSKDNVDLIVVPKNLRKRYLGFDKTFAAINNRFNWPKMKTEILKAEILNRTNLSNFAKIQV